MKTWVRKSLNVGVLSAGFLLISGGAAHADWTTGYNAGLLNGNQFDTTLQLPVNVCGNSIAVLGFADASCDGGGATAVNTESASATESATTEDWTTGYNAGVGNGNQLDTTLQVPLNISGNAVSVLGFSSASSSGGATAVNGGGAGAGAGSAQSHSRHDHHSGGGSANSNGGYNAGAMGDYTEAAANRTEDWTSGYNAGLLNGNQFDTTLQAPVNVSGNALSLFGFSSASSTGGAWAVNDGGSTESATTEDWTTGYNAGLLNGNQTDTTIQLPINLCGNAIAVFGFASASCDGGAGASNGGGGAGSDNDGNGAGNGSDNGGYGDDGSGSDNGGYGGGTGNSNGDNGYGGTGNSNGGYGNSNAVANPNAYGNSNGNASDTGAANDASGTAAAAAAHKTTKHHKAKMPKEVSLNQRHHGHGHGHGTGAGTGTADSNGGYGNGSSNGVGDDNGYGDGSGNGNGNAADDNGGGNGGANAINNSCSDWTTGYNAGLLNGNQADTTIQLPINISGNAISLFGFSQASSQGGALAYNC